MSVQSAAIMAASAAATVLGGGAFTPCSSTPRQRFSRRPASVDTLSCNQIIFPATRTMRSSSVLASNPDRQQGKTYVGNPDSSSSSFQEDLNYTLQLGAGSVAGAALVKYGSILFPDITRPNLVQALIMILTPVVVAVYLLVKQSRAD